LTLRKPKTARRMPAHRTEAQEKAFRLFRLRALWVQALLLTGERQRGVRALVDEEITLLGGEPQAFRDHRRTAEWAALEAADNQAFEEVAQS